MPAPSRPAPEHAKPLPPPKARARALTPRASARTTRSLSSPRTTRALSSPYACQSKHQIRSSLATQVWKYYDNSGYDTTADGATGQRLKALRKCRCLFCDQVMKASPVKMATHIATLCPIADPFAKRALLRNKPDHLTTQMITNPQPKPRRPYELMTADDWREECFGSRTQWTDHSASTTFVDGPVHHAENNAESVSAGLVLSDVVRRIEEMADTVVPETTTPSDSNDAELGSCSAPTDPRARFVDETIDVKSLVCASAAKKHLDKSATAASTKADKENLPPAAQTVPATTSTAKKRRFGNRAGESERQHGLYRNSSKRSQGCTEPIKKRLFCDHAADGSRNEADSAKSDQHSTPDLLDAELLVRDFMVACVMENVPISFLTSASFAVATKRHCGAPSDVDLRQLAENALQNLAAPVDDLVESTRLSSSAVTFVVKRATLSKSYRAVVYLVDEESTSMLLSCQQKLYQMTSTHEKEEWLDEVASHYLRVSELCGRHLHVCVSDYPLALQNGIFEAIDSLTEFNRLFGRCMLEEFDFLRRETMEYLSSTANVLRASVELGMLVNEVERYPMSRRNDSSPIQISIPNPHDHNLYGYVLLLKQLLLVKQEVVLKYQSGHGLERSRARKRSGSLSRLKSLLDAIQDHWGVISDTLDLLLPFATMELLKMNAFVSSSTALKLTSGTLFCLELWLFSLVSRSPLLTNAEKTQWKEMFLSRSRSAKMDHQLAALLLDPRTAGSGLSCAGRRSGRACIMKLCERVAPNASAQSVASQLADYMNKTGIFSSRSIWFKENTSNPISFWKGIECAPELREIALTVCSYTPASPTSRAHASISETGCNLEQNIRTAQIKHHLRTREAIPDPVSLSSTTSLRLLGFINRAHSGTEMCTDSTGSDHFLFELEQFPCKASHETILESSESYAMSFRSLRDEALNQSRVSRRETQEQQNGTHRFRLESFSESWIDCSDMSLHAIQNAIDCLLV